MIILAFLLGVVNSLLATLFYNVVAKHRALMAAVLAVPVYGISLFVINKVLIVDRDLLSALLYIIGCAIGTFITTSLSKRIKRKDT